MKKKLTLMSFIISFLLVLPIGINSADPAPSVPNDFVSTYSHGEGGW